MKLVWDNHRQVPPAKNTKSHSRHYTPSGGSMADKDDRFLQHYQHLFTIGACQMQQNCADALTDEYKRRIAISKRMAKMLQDM